jgi:predicted hydrocarbon binding protein
MLLEVFIINKQNSLLMVHRSFTKKELQMDGHLFSGLIATISSFITEMKIGQIKHFEAGDIRILISTFEEIFVVGLVEEQHEDEFISNSLRAIAESFWAGYKDQLKEWNGDLLVFNPFLNQIDDIVYSGFTKQYLSKDYPKHIVSVTRQFQNKFEPPIMKFIGKKVGLARGQASKDLNIIKKKLIKEINLFSISELKESANNSFRIEISMCPICRGIKDKNFSCKFFEGFIEGYLAASLTAKTTLVKETQCIAHGNPDCRFEIEFKEFFNFVS